MSGSRLNNVKAALIPFISEICEDANTIIKLILFCHETDLLEIPKDKSACQAFLENNIKSRGGTDFYIASKALVDCAQTILDENPTHQVSELTLQNLLEKFFKNFLVFLFSCVFFLV